MPVAAQEELRTQSSEVGPAALPPEEDWKVSQAASLSPSPSFWHLSVVLWQIMQQNPSYLSPILCQITAEMAGLVG